MGTPALSTYIAPQEQPMSEEAKSEPPKKPQSKPPPSNMDGDAEAEEVTGK